MDGVPSRSQLDLSANDLQLTVIADLPARLLLSSKTFLTDLYVEKGLSAAQIAKKIFSLRSTVQDALNRNGIPARNGVDSNHSQKFGRKRLKGRSVAHNGEQRIIATIQKLASQGLSLPKICEILKRDESANEKVREKVASGNGTKNSQSQRKE